MNELRRARLRALMIVGALGLFGGVMLPRLRVVTEITHFLPSGEERESAALVRELAQSELNRTVTLLVEGPELDAAARAAAALGETLAASSEVAWVRTGPDERLNESFYALYFPHRFGFADPQVFASEEALDARIAATRRRLVGSAGALVRPLVPRDPWLFFLTQIERLRADAQGEIALHRLEGADPVFVLPEGAGPGEGAAAVVLLASRHSPFDAGHSRALLDDIDRAFAALPGAASLHLRMSSVHRIALQSETTLRADITRVSTAGSVGVVLLLLALFGSLRILASSTLPLVGATVVALGTTQLVFGQIHGLTLAFGATLIGVAIDYVAHLLNHHVLEPEPPERGGPLASLRVIWPGLVVGAGTTVAGLLGLAWTSFPGIREMAVFTSVGVSAALLLTRYLLAPLLPLAPRPTWLHRRLARVVTEGLAGLRTRRAPLLALLAFALVLVGLGVPRVRWDDDIRALGALDPALLAEDEAVRAAVARMEAGQIVVARGATLDEALVVNDRVFSALGDAQAAEELTRFRSLSPMLPAPSTQRARRAALPDDAWERTAAALTRAGFRPELFDGSELAAPLSPLTWDEVTSTPLGELVRSFRIDTESGPAVLSFVQGVRDPDALRTRIAEIEGARFVDQAGLMERTYRAFRTRTLELVGVGLLVVLLIVALRYRDPRQTMAAFLPALLAAGLTLGVLGLVGMPANLLSVVTLLLVLSMGVDYGVFMVEAGRRASAAHASAPIESTVVSLLIACASTVLSFGVLGMSASPAMRAMGTTAAIGVFTSLLLAPLAWLVLGVDLGAEPGENHSAEPGADHGANPSAEPVKGQRAGDGAGED